MYFAKTTPLAPVGKALRSASLNKSVYDPPRLNPLGRTSFVNICGKISVPMGKSEVTTVDYPKRNGRNALNLCLVGGVPPLSRSRFLRAP
jgi:hypothetical protein